MNKQLTLTTTLSTIGWLLLRLTILNVVILIVAFALAAARNLFEPTDQFVMTFPFRLYVATLFLTNLVYIIGNTFESIYLRLWDKAINVRDFEKKFFKAGLAMTLIVNATGVVMYVIDYLE
ncbi:hypothetical protein [Phaeocystidibacter luteus]|uniref:Uncharacterized protein n=1 Tax=Phaeocystidibacter luteus TaxID=911197 RepID=A0A6N6RDY9_9FLAO|nr:hypothetical protein [Phaeocystidibacter luteus]KAB2807697.1 hypothetical protein F8C67_11695 [Phaeocystidibacter luteus]